ncbi:hypothetical protein RhiirC2_796972 [Rhizophagus irregularis]|uniref:Uncharacterized protein n=1 Tax=Rhizophagus irregularis TaxID=588596 RepID=A0A2N1M8S2_9GLOM|nr:hypothetical protein RhiirC2_796972 [Rhizophagus irregularis]
MRPEYFIETSSATYITNLESIIKNENFFNTLKKKDKVKPIWVLFVDGKPNKNLKYTKNIIQYTHLFHFFNLNDYLTIYTYVSNQSAYNLVKQSIASLFEKFAGITLPIKEFVLHLNNQKNMINKKLAR